MRVQEKQPSIVSTTTCRLCQRTAPLCKSHIIPEFIFTSMYDAKHRFIEVADVAQGKVGRVQKGYWERLLCGECESVLNRYERHTRRLFVDTLPPTIPPSKRMRAHPRLEYARTKLFFLSILWRSSISTLGWFKHVRLGPYEEKIRQMILAGNPGSATDFAITIFALNFQGTHFQDFIVEPTHMRFEGRKCYRFVLGGFVVFVFVAAELPPEPFPRLILDPSRAIHTFDGELGDFPFLKYVWEKAAETTRNVELD